MTKTNPEAAELERLSRLVDLGRQLAEPALPLSDKLQSCVALLAELIGAEQASLMLVEGPMLVVHAATNPEVVGLANPLDATTISGRVVATAQPVHLTDVDSSDMADLGRGGDKSHYRTGSLISLPLMDGDKAMGVLNLADKAGAQAFDDADLDLAQGIARQMERQVIFSALHSRLEEAYQELRRTQRSKDELMHMIFHDMKAPITAVKGIIRLLGPEGGLGEAERAQYLALADGDLEQLWRRITNLLDLNRMDSGEMPVQSQAVDLALVAAESLDNLRGIAAAQAVDLEFTAPWQGQARADEELVERILGNLLFNAIKVSSPEQGGGGRMAARVEARDDQAMVTVEDSGPGVDPALGQSIFERYTRGPAASGSTGLGLYFCRRAAWLMGGDVGYRNRPEGGAAFWLTLPLRRGGV